jgi:hypothetical protein
MTEVKLTEADLLEKGLRVMQRVLDQPVQVTRTDMADLLNFEVVVTNMVRVMRELHGKTAEELLAYRQQVEVSAPMS